MARKTLEQLNQFYPPGLYEWLYANKKSEYDRLIDIEKKIDLAILNDEDEKEFKTLLVEYWQIHKSNIHKFNNSDNTELNLTEIREERLEDRAAT